MALHFISTRDKPLMHLSMADWSSRLGRLQDVARARCDDTFKLRNTTRTLRNETNIEGRWASYETNSALDDRIDEVTLWRNLLAKTYSRLEKEIEGLKGERKLTEDELEWQSGPITVMREILFIRDNCVETELTNDPSGTELQNELYILETNQRLLADIIKKAWDKLTRLEDVRLKLQEEVQNKVDTINVDKTARELDLNSTTTSFVLDPLRAVRDGRTYLNWLEYTRNLKNMVDNEIEETVTIRETLFVCRERARSMLEAQRDRTTSYIRSRIFQTQQAVNGLKFQQTRMREELADSSCELDALEAALHEKRGSLKLAETRLESRLERCPTERCMDNAHDLLQLEVEKIREMRRCLESKLEESRANFNLLSNHAQKIDEDLEKKQQALDTSQRAFDLRERLKQEESGFHGINPCAQTDKNVQLIRMEDIVEKV